MGDPTHQEQNSQDVSSTPRESYYGSIIIRVLIEGRGRSYGRVLNSSLITLIWLSSGAPHD